MSLIDEARVAVEAAKTRYREDLRKNAERLLDRAVRQDPSSLSAARNIQSSYEDLAFSAMDLRPLAHHAPTPDVPAVPDHDEPDSTPQPPDPPAKAPTRRRGWIK